LNPFLADFLALVELHGEWMLFLLAVGETSFVTGLLVPSGLATALATILALEGHLSLPSVAAAAVGGGWFGDSIGFWIGWRGGAWLSTGESRFARRFRREREEADRIFGRHPLVSVTLARMVSFVRTIMPMAAGMSRMRYSRFLLYEGLGLVAWAALYMTVGYVAGEGMEEASRVIGAGGTVVFAAAAVVLWKLGRRRRRRVPERSRC